MADNAERKLNNRCVIYGAASGQTDTGAYRSGAAGERRATASMRLLGQVGSAVRGLIAEGVNTFVTDAGDELALETAGYILKLRKVDPNLHLVLARPYRASGSESDYAPGRAQDYAPGRAPDRASDFAFGGQSGFASGREFDRASGHAREWVEDARSRTLLNEADMVKYIADSEAAYVPGRLDAWMIAHCDTVLIIGAAADAENADAAAIGAGVAIGKAGAADAGRRSAGEAGSATDVWVRGTVEDRLAGFDLSGKRVIRVMEQPGTRLDMEKPGGAAAGAGATMTKRGVAEPGGAAAGAGATGGFGAAGAGAPRTGVAPGHGDGKTREGSGAGRLRRGIDINEVVVAAEQVPGSASFRNFDELRAYLRSGLELYNSTEYSIENIELARRDHFVLKKVRKKLADTKKAIQKEYSAPVELVVEQLDELIGMVDEPFKAIDKLLKSNAKEIKRREIMRYATTKAYELGKYANSVLHSPSFFNPRWCNVSYAEAKWKADVDGIVERAAADIRYIVDNAGSDAGVVLGYYFEKLSLDGVEAFLGNVRAEEASMPPETVYIDVNTGEVVEQAGGFGAFGGAGGDGLGAGAAFGAVGGLDGTGGGPGGELGAVGAFDGGTVGDPGGELGAAGAAAAYGALRDGEVRRSVVLRGKPEDIESYLGAAESFGVKIDGEM